MASVRMLALAATVFLASGVSRAAIIRCDATEPDEHVGLEWIAYDTTTRAASIRYAGKTLRGLIALSRPHKPFSDKLNIVFPSPFSSHDKSARMEVMVFPVSEVQHRLVGAVTVLVEGERHMDYGVKNVFIRCRELPR